MGGAECGRWQLQFACLHTTKGMRPLGAIARNPINKNQTNAKFLCVKSGVTVYIVNKGATHFPQGFAIIGSYKGKLCFSKI